MKPSTLGGDDKTHSKKRGGRKQKREVEKVLLREYNGEDNENVHEQRSTYENMQYLSPKEKEDFEKTTVNWWRSWF